MSRRRRAPKPCSKSKFLGNRKQSNGMCNVMDSRRACRQCLARFRYKNGREVIPSKTIAIDKVDDAHYRLTVGSVSPDDVATYRVEAGNEAGTVSSEASLTIKQRAAPKEEEPMEVESAAEATLTIVKGLEDQKVDEGQDVTLEVQLSAAPALLKW